MGNIYDTPICRRVFHPDGSSWLAEVYLEGPNHSKIIDEFQNKIDDWLETAYEIIIERLKQMEKEYVKKSKK